MSDDGFDDIDFGNGGSATNDFDEDEEDDDDDRENRNAQNSKAALKLYGKSQEKQSELNSEALSHIQFKKARNNFEKFLEELGVKIGFDTDAESDCAILLGAINHDEFTKKLERKMLSNCGSNVLFDAFSAACAESSHNFVLYVSPMKSKFGVHDTILRAFLTAKTSQQKAFQFLLQHLNSLARKRSEEDLKLASICVAHIRYLEKLYEPVLIFNLIFENPIYLWEKNVRNDLINALPEIFSDFNLQQETALQLKELIQKSDEVEDLASFQCVIIETLLLLRMEPAVGQEIRECLTENCLKFDSSTIPLICAFSLESLLSSNSSNLKIDEEEARCHKMLNDFSKNLKIEQIQSGSAGKAFTPDNIAFNAFEHFLRFLQLDKKNWKYIQSYISKNEKGSIKQEEKTEWMSSFEMFLICSLISSEYCPSGLVTAFNSRFLNLPSTSPSAVSKFLKLIDLILSFKKFSTFHLSSLIHIGRQCLWNSDQSVRNLGINVYKQIFIGMNQTSRGQIFEEMLKHFQQNEVECEAVLEVFCKIVKTNPDILMDYSQKIQGCVESIHVLSTSNIKKLFQVLLLMGGKNENNLNDIEEVIERFLMSINNRERFLGILALIVKIQCQMTKRRTEAQEKLIQNAIERIENASEKSSALRGAFFEHFTVVIQNHKRLEEIRFLTQWSQKLLEQFKTNFFVEEENESNESEAKTCKFALKVKNEKMVEVVPMFNLIKELFILKMKWKDEDSDSIGSSYSISAISELLFAFEANLEIEDGENMNKEECSGKYFFQIQWCRTILNAFFGQSSANFMEAEEITTATLKLFYLMKDSEVKLISNLMNRKNWIVPNCKFEVKDEVLIIATPSSSASGGNKAKKRRKSDENEGMEIVDVEEEEETLKTNPNLKVQLAKYFVQLKLRPIVHLMELTKQKRSCQNYLCDELKTVLQELAKSKKKKIISPFLMGKAAIEAKKAENIYHGDSIVIWNCVKKAIEQIWVIIASVFEFFSSFANSDREINAKLQKDMEELGEKSLELLHIIFGSQLYGNDEKLTSDEKNEKQGVLIRIIEKQILNKEEIWKDVDDAKFELGKYLIKIAEFAPNIFVALLILNVFEDLKLKDEKLNKTMAKFALAYLKRNWNKNEDEEGAVKKSRFNAAVKNILKHYFSLRKEKDQLLAIQWILTNKVVQLVPDEEKRKSEMFSQRSDDDLLKDEDRKEVFSCINKSTFGVVFDTLFNAINCCVGRKEMTAEALQKELITVEQTVAYWETASSCFLILCLLLRITKIRTVAVMYTAIKEGKQFLINVSRKSSFIYLMNNVTKSNESGCLEHLGRILSNIQQGNRVLLSIGTYAKTSKRLHLLKKFPEFLAENENCLRIIHSAMVKNECLEALTVGLSKSRSIDGELITERETSPESDED